MNSFFTLVFSTIFCMQKMPLLQKMVDLYRHFIIYQESRMGRIDGDMVFGSVKLGFMHKYRAVIGLQMRLKLGEFTVTG